MRTYAFIVLLLAAVIAAPLHLSPAMATTSPKSAALLAEELLREFNARPGLAPYVAENFAASTLARSSAEDLAQPLEELKRLGGRLSLAEWGERQDGMAEVIVRTERGGRFARLVLFRSSREPDRIAQLFILPARDPARARTDAFPTSAVDDAQLLALVRRRLDALAEEDSFAGAVLVARGDEVLLREARGLAERSFSVPNTPSTRFNIASMNKMWTALIVLKLAEQGKVSLDDSLARLVPEYPHPAAAEAISLRMLLQHQAAIGDWDVRAFKRKMRPGESAATMTSPPGEPGKAFAYSNAGYILLAAAAEKASGKSYEELVAEMIFVPAGMTRSGFWPVTAIVDDRATGYLRPPEDPLGFGPYYSNAQYLGYGGDASGGAYSTLDDLFAFHRALQAGALVSRETLGAMTGASVDFAGAPRPTRYGLGLRLETCAGAPTLGHSGGGAGSGVSASSYAGLDGRWTVIVLANVDPVADRLAFDICELVHRDS